MNKILLLGAGSIGKRHLMNAITAGARDFTIVDPREDRQQEAKGRARNTIAALEKDKQTSLNLSFAMTSEEAYANYGPFTAVFIAMPPVAHLQEIEKAIDNEAAIFCEKPLAKDDLDWNKAVELIEIIEKNKIINMVAYNYRFYPQLIQLRELLQKDTVGQIHTIRGTFSECVRDWHPWEGLDFYMSSKELGGGALLDESHLVDICRWLFGDMTQVISLNETISSLKDEEIFETDDVVEMMTRFESGAIGSLHMDLFGQYHQKKIEVIGEEGTLLWFFDNSDLASNHIEFWKGRREKLSDTHAKRLPEAIFEAEILERNYMYLKEIEYFFECVKEGKAICNDVPNIEDSLKTMAVLRAARNSSKSKRFEDVETFSITKNGD